MSGYSLTQPTQGNRVNRLLSLRVDTGRRTADPAE
jgi:hypothetical protein